MWYVILPLIFFVYKVYNKSTCGICHSNKQLHNKVVIVTGANAGIGYETAKDLADRGAKIILGCRDEKRGNSAKDKIIKYTGNKQVYFKQLDLSSFKSIHRFAKEIIENETRIDILINNAGTGKLDNSLTEDNLPVEMQINHFGPFLLTQLLLPLLKSSAPSRIIFVASVMHYFGKIDLNKIHLPAGGFFQHSRVYSNSKLANVLTTKQLSHLLADSNVTVNCLHPGAVNTEIFKNQPRFVRFLIRLVFKTPWEGAQTTLHLALAPEVENVSGKYFKDCEEASVSKKAQDPELAKKLYEFSDAIVNKSLKENVTL